LWIALSESNLLSDFINGGGFGFQITYPDWVTDIAMDTNLIAWSELTPTDQQNVVNHFGGVEGMKEKLCDEGWDQYCEDEDGYESKASDDYEVDVDEYIKTGDPTQELPKDKRAKESFTNKFGIEYELEDEDDDLYRDLYSQQIDEGDEEEVFKLLEKYDNNNPYASDKDMADEIERNIGWLSGWESEKDALTLVHQWKQTRY